MTRSPEVESTDINDVFPHKVCINLDRRPKRWEEAQKEFARHEIKFVQRFSAVDGNKLIAPAHWQRPKGAYGCLLSHLQVVEEARQRGLPNILIFEDDVVFDSQFRDKFALYIRQLPPVWDMLFFGACTGTTRFICLRMSIGSASPTPLLPMRSIKRYSTVSSFPIMPQRPRLTSTIWRFRRRPSAFASCRI